MNIDEYGWKRCSEHWLFHWYIKDHEKFINIYFISQFVIFPLFMLNKIFNSLCNYRKRAAISELKEAHMHCVYLYTITLLYPE